MEDCDITPVSLDMELAVLHSLGFDLSDCSLFLFVNLLLDQLIDLMTV